MLLRLAYRLATEVSPRLAWKAARLWVFKGARTVKAYRRRLQRGELFPPFFFLALTTACNLRCRGCWIPGGAPLELSEKDVETIIAAGKQQHSYFYTLLGGEPMLYPRLWSIIERHPECYFQIITNGMFFDERNVQRLAAAGNVTPLISIDGLQEDNDRRRGKGVFQAAVEGIARLRQHKVLFGVATTVTSENIQQVLSDGYVQQMIRLGAMYLWYYGYRPVGADPAPHLALDKQQMLQFRRELLRLRRRHAILLIDTYWDAAGQAVCPAALGLGFHIGPEGSIEPCPPLRFAAETVGQHDGNLFDCINRSQFLRQFSEFARSKTRGCVILEAPQELAQFIRDCAARDYSRRDMLAELMASTPRPSHDLPGEHLPEDHWLYKLLKKQLFFGMGGYG